MSYWIGRAWLTAYRRTAAVGLAHFNGSNAKAVPNAGRHDVVLMTQTRQTNQLPAPLTEPIDPGWWTSLPRWQLRYPVRYLAGQVLDGEDVMMMTPTRGRIDTGSWFRNARIWMWVLRDELLLIAAGWGGPNPYVQRVPFSELTESVYNHVTDELVLAPAMDVPVKALGMCPTSGYQVLSQIYANADQPAPAVRGAGHPPAPAGGRDDSTDF